MSLLIQGGLLEGSVLVNNVFARAISSLFPYHVPTSSDTNIPADQETFTHEPRDARARIVAFKAR
jgi:hypothetical protein